MKKILSMVALLAVIAWVAPSCSSTKNTGTVANVGRGKFTGTWTVTSITYDGLLENAVQNVFDQAPPSQFRGSTWKLTNSGNGMYTLNDGTSQTIFWSVNNATPGAQMFQFKKIYQGDKPKNVAEGYQLYVAENNGSTMTLKSPVPIGRGGTAYVIYTFAKN